MIDVENFAGPGGWSEGRRMVGATNPCLAIEIDLTACLTAQAAGHARVCADVLRYATEPLVGKVRRYISSPPCTAFSSAGQGAGRQVMGILSTAMTRIMRGRKAIRWAEREASRVLRAHVLTANPGWTRARRSAWARQQARLSALVLQPARWVHDTRPRMVALEQVPGVLPLWQHMAALLREAGYSVWCGILSAEEYGVPQTRKRAILIASLDGAVSRPAPTHQPYRAGVEVQTEPDLFGDPLPPPVSMAEALGWAGAEQRMVRGAGMTERYGERPNRSMHAPSQTITAGSKGSGPRLEWSVAPAGAASKMVEPRPAPAPAHTITGKGTAAWVLRTGNNSMVTSRTGSKAGEGGVQPYERQLDVPAPTLDTMVGSKWRIQPRADWIQERPATTVCGDPRIGRPGHKDRQGGESQFAEASVRVSVAEASVLQSFPADYPWRGSKSEQYRQVGDAVPPLLAAAVLAQFVKVDEERVAA